MSQLDAATRVLHTFQGKPLHRLLVCDIIHNVASSKTWVATRLRRRMLRISPADLWPAVRLSGCDPSSMSCAGCLARPEARARRYGLESLVTLASLKEAL
jgi:hypothetical protein